MLTRRELCIKWSLYALVVAAVTLLYMLTLRDARLLGIRFFLPPLFVGVVASIEGARAGMIFGLVYGALCDLTLAGTFPCVYTVAFVLAAALCAALSENVLQAGVLCSIISTLLCFLVLDALNMAALALRDGATARVMLSLAARETVVSCPMLAVVHPPLMFLHRRFIY